MSPPPTYGIVHVASHDSVEETVRSPERLLDAKGVRRFALIDHSEETEKVGLRMPPTRLRIFGSPRAGTPVRVAAPSIAVDLPLKILVWEDADAKVWISDHSPQHLPERHHRSDELLRNIAVVESLAAAVNG